MNSDPYTINGPADVQTQSPWNVLMQFLSTWPKVWTTAASFQIAFVVGFIDLVTGFEVSVSFFYLLPIALGTWFAGRVAGGSVAAFSTAVWLAADMLSRPHYRHPLTPYWNTLIMGLWFAAAVVLLSALKQAYESLEATVLHHAETLRSEIAERRRAQEQLTCANSELTLAREQLQQSRAELQKTQWQLTEAAKQTTKPRLQMETLDWDVPHLCWPPVICL